MTITSGQCRAARALLRWTQDALAEKADVTQRTIALFEVDERNPVDETRSKLRRALERGGIEFIDENGGGAGVRLKGSRKKRRPK